jgi:hypothetical protein
MQAATRAHPHAPQALRSAQRSAESTSPSPVRSAGHGAVIVTVAATLVAAPQVFVKTTV